MPTYFQWGPKKKRCLQKGERKLKWQREEHGNKLNKFSQLLIHGSCGKVGLNLGFEGILVRNGLDGIGQRIPIKSTLIKK